MSAHPQVLALIQRGDVPLPIISLNGTPSFAGGIDAAMVIQELREMGVAPVEKAE